MSLTNFDSMSLVDLARTCEDLESKANRATRHRLRVRSEAEDSLIFGPSDDDILAALSAEVTANNAVNKCEAALSRRLADKTPHPSTLTNDPVKVSVSVDESHPNQPRSAACLAFPEICEDLTGLTSAAKTTTATVAKGIFVAGGIVLVGWLLREAV